MELRRFFAEQKNTTGNTVIIDGDEFIHLARVLRLGAGDEIIVCFNDGKDNFAVIKKIEKNFASAEIYRTEYNLCEPGRRISLFQALIKGEKEDLLIQKAVELGVYEIYPFESEHCTVKITGGEGKRERLNKIAKEACKQCGRACIAEVKPFITFNAMLEKLKSFDKVIFASELEERNSLKDSLSSSPNPAHIALVIGSEGGFTMEEHKKIVEAGAEPVTLGNRIMRAETAGISLISAVSFYLGEWEKR